MTNTQAERSETIFVQVIERPARKALVKWSKTAKEYFSYCNEVGCDIWGVLCSVPEALYEPIGMWVPQNLRPKDTGRYAQGVELPLDYDKPVPQGYDLIELPPCKMMIFQGEPFEDEVFYEAIKSLEKRIDDYTPQLYGFEWADADGPRFQLEPQGYRGYIEARPVREVKK